MEIERLAVIDIGSNSVRLMVAQATAAGALEVLCKDRRVTRLAQGMVETGRIAAEAMDRTVNGIAELLSIAEGMDVDRVLAFATAAVRNAANREEFIQTLHQRTRLLARVLSGEEEAQASYLGAAQGLTAAMIDIGGASTEVLIGEEGAFRAARSFGMGAVAALERYPLGNPCDELSLLAMEQWVQTVLREGKACEIRECLGGTQDLTWICVGGTASSIASMDLRLEAYQDQAIHGHRISLERIEAMRSCLARMTLEERRGVTGLDPMRADIIVGGMTILLGLMHFFGITGVTVSSGDNLEGYVRMKLFPSKGE